MEILIEFDWICRANSINYILSSGSLLGTIQHKGFVPGDDDVAMFCYPGEYTLGVKKMKFGDIIEIDSFDELCAVDKSYCGYKQKKTITEILQMCVDSIFIPCFFRRVL